MSRQPHADGPSASASRSEWRDVAAGWALAASVLVLLVLLA